VVQTLFFPKGDYFGSMENMKTKRELFLEAQNRLLQNLLVYYFLMGLGLGAAAASVVFTIFFWMERN